MSYFFAALKKIPIQSLKQDLYRGVPLDLVRQYPHKYDLSKSFVEYAFISATFKLDQISPFLGQFQRTIFAINGCFSGRLIHPFSANPSECEILLPPTSRFEVVGHLKLDANTTIVQVKQLSSLENDVLQLENGIEHSLGHLSIEDSPHPLVGQLMKRRTLTLPFERAYECGFGPIAFFVSRNGSVSVRGEGMISSAI